MVSDCLDFGFAVCNLVYNRAYRKILNKKPQKAFYAGKPICLPEETNKWLYDRIIEGNPLMVARYGAVELRIIQEKLFIEKGLRKGYGANVLSMASINAGIFDANEMICDQFVEEMKQASKSVDLLGTWYNDFEDYAIRQFCNLDVRLTQLRSLEPWRMNYNIPWTHALKGKKVLVIHPFAESIQHQYSNKDIVFPNHLLPEFELQTYKAVQTIAGIADNRFENWFEALEYMKNSIIQIDYDIAIIGCGAYGFLLAEACKKMGKQAIHLGGVTQILFGIKGKRWENDRFVAPMINEYWIKPNKCEIPTGSQKVENGCYW